MDSTRFQERARPFHGWQSRTRSGICCWPRWKEILTGSGRCCGKNPAWPTATGRITSPCTSPSAKDTRRRSALLLDHGADPSSASGLDYHVPPLERARDRGYDEIAGLLTDAIASRYSAPPVGERACEVVRRGDLEEARALFKASPELINASDERGNRPLHEAVAAHNLEMTALLLDQGAEPDPVRWDGCKPLHVAVFRARKSRGGLDPLLTGYLIARGADYSMTVACALGDERRVRSLLSRDRALANDQDSCGHSPLFSAASQGYTDIVQLLLDHGADPNAPEHNAPRGHALYEAVAGNHLETDETAARSRRRSQRPGGIQRRAPLPGPRQGKERGDDQPAVPARGDGRHQHVRAIGQHPRGRRAPRRGSRPGQLWRRLRSALHGGGLCAQGRNHRDVDPGRGGTEPALVRQQLHGVRVPSAKGLAPGRARPDPQRRYPRHAEHVFRPWRRSQQRELARRHLPAQTGSDRRRREIRPVVGPGRLHRGRGRRVAFHPAGMDRALGSPGPCGVSCWSGVRTPGAAARNGRPRWPVRRKPVMRKSSRC